MDTTGTVALLSNLLSGMQTTPLLAGSGGVVSACVARAEAEGLEPPRACARRISSAVPPLAEKDARGQTKAFSCISAYAKSAYGTLKYAWGRYGCCPSCCQKVDTVRGR